MEYFRQIKRGPDMIAALEKRFKIAKLMICLPIGLALVGCSKVQHHVFIAENVVVSGTADDSMALQKNMPFLSQKCSEVSDGFGLQLDQLLKAGWKVTSSQPHTHPGLQVVLPIGGPATVGCVGTSYIIERSEWFWKEWVETKTSVATAPPAPAPVKPNVASSATEPPPSDVPNLADAFQTAFNGNTTVSTPDGLVAFKPVKIVHINSNLFALLSEGSIADGCNGCSGKLRITYLIHSNYGFILDDKQDGTKIEKDIDGGGPGNPPEWKLSTGHDGEVVLRAEENFSMHNGDVDCILGIYRLLPAGVHEEPESEKAAVAAGSGDTSCHVRS
jgi:hypothetical protein